ncbi:MAG: molybdopterin-guanine dinucleotide biosynthesis protein B [Planctomycetota bacterium]|jgi:molybdopterin-guanine dinucleotide biosynthesis protein B
MKAVVAFVGKSNSGKTTVLEKVVAELSGRGRRVGVIKHDAHEFEIDHEGKDSYRLKHAGAKTAVISSAGKFAMVTDLDAPLELETIVARYFADCEIVLAEGWKKEAKVKIEVFRTAAHAEPLCPKGRADGLIGLVTDDDIDLGVPKFATGDAKGIADLIEKKFASDRGAGETRLIVNGRTVFIKGFVQEFIGNVVEGAVRSLRGGEKAKTIELRVQTGEYNETAGDDR